jgi:hypothetical protein
MSMEFLLYIIVGAAGWLAGMSYAHRRAAERRYRDDLDAYNQRRFPYDRQSQLPNCGTTVTYRRPEKDNDHE